MRIVVSGATGNTGKPCAIALARAGHQVIAITRDINGKEAQDLANNYKNIEVVLLGDAFKQPVDRAFIVSRLASFADETELIRLAKEAGAKYIVKIATGARAMNNTKIPAGKSHQDVEKFLEDGVVPWTSLRPNTFFPNTGIDYSSVPTTKKFKFLYGNTSVAAVDPVDVGEIAAALLSLDDPSPHFGKKYEVAGLHDINIPFINKLLTKVLGIDVQGEPYSRDDLIGLYKLYIPANVEETVDGLIDLFENHPASTKESKTDPELLKLAPVKRDFEGFVRKVYGK